MRMQLLTGMSTSTAEGLGDAAITHSLRCHSQLRNQL